MMFCLSLALLWWNWQEPQGLSFSNAVTPDSSQRLIQNMGVNWERFSSLRQAWTEENQPNPGQNRWKMLTQGSPVFLPSSEKVSVVAQHFRIPGEWSARYTELVCNGVIGHASVYLNGVDSSHLIGDFEGYGARNVLEIPAAAFRYGQDNVLIIQLGAGEGQKQSLFGSSWLGSGQITGSIFLEAMPETSLAYPRITTAWKNNVAQMTIGIPLIHHSLSEQGPWTVDALLSDGSAGIAEGTTTVQPNESAAQQVNMTLNINNPHLWSPKDPYLYQLHLTVVNARGDTDDLAFPVGIKNLGFNKGKVQLNSQPVTVKGIAVSNTLEDTLRHNNQEEAWLKSQKAKGINLIYFDGVFPQESLLDITDKLGLGVWLELPVSMVPSNYLPDPSIYSQMVALVSRHPSVWAFTLGKGLDPRLPETTTYLQKAEQVVKPYLPFVLRNGPRLYSSFTAERTPLIQGNMIEGSWGKVSLAPEPGSTNIHSWPKEELASYIWLAIVFFVTWMNITSVDWRYKEINEKRPKRRLRKAWFWHGWGITAREATLAGTLTAMIFAYRGFGPWFPHLLPQIRLWQFQSPWLIWLTITFALIILRLWQIGIVAPHLQGSPHPLGLAFWLERRYRWTIIVALLWALGPWGIPVWAPWAGYGALSVLFLPLRIRDIHRAGGKYLPFLIVPGLLVGIVLIWSALHWADWFYLWGLIFTR